MNRPNILQRHFAIVFLLTILTTHICAQTNVVMPHHGVDTLYIDRSTCYQILDPGGLSKYENNEDSWLYIFSNEGDFYLEIDYQTSAYDDGTDWIRIHEYADSTSWYANLCGEGSYEQHIWSSHALIRFHSNNYAMYDGFTIKIKFTNTIFNQSVSRLTDNSVRIIWDDNPLANHWTITYYCDEDTLQTTTSNTKNVILDGLRSNTYYKYYIENNTTQCMNHDIHSFYASTDPGVLLTPTFNNSYDTIDSIGCFTIFDAGGPGSNSLLQHGHEARFLAHDSVGFYLKGSFRNSDNLLYSILTPWGTWDHWMGRSGFLNMYVPKGALRLFNWGDNKFAFKITQENTLWITPHIDSVNSTSATISWTDRTASTSWKVNYGTVEGHFHTVTTTSPTITISGLKPNAQYIYTIEGNDTLDGCMVPCRWGLRTPLSSDTIIMPYRGIDSITIYPGSCYNVLDAGAQGNYYHTDFSKLHIRSADGRGFRVSGMCSINDDDRLVLDNGIEQRDFYNNNNDIEVVYPNSEGWIYFYSNNIGNNFGFSLRIEMLEPSVTNVRSSNITANSATILWDDNSSASQWTVYYGLSEDTIHAITTSIHSATLTGLTGGTQYIYWIRSNTMPDDTCRYADRRAFITNGVSANTVIMPYRGIDTLYVSHGTCYVIRDGGGENHNYFNNDTSILVLISTDGSDFTVSGYFDYETEQEMRSDGYDGNDRLCFGDESYFYDCHDGWYNPYYHHLMRHSSNNGYLRLRFTSNRRRTFEGYHLQIDRDNDNIQDVKFHLISKDRATLSWTDNSNAASWTLYYGPVGGTTQSIIVNNSSNIVLQGLMSSTQYNVYIQPNNGTGPSSPCELKPFFFQTLDDNSILMTPNSNDTVIIHPYQCYTVYDAGGNADYLPNDISSLTLISSTGQGFFMRGYFEVGSSDYSDCLSFNNEGCGQHWWNEDRFCHDGKLTVSMNTNEAFQNTGFVFKIWFYPSIYNPDTIYRTDSTALITWQDSSAASKWYFSWGSDIDSMTTIECLSRNAGLSGLRRNQQYLYRIDNDASYQHCVLPAIYGLVMPTDDSILIVQYRNYYMANAGFNALHAWDNVVLQPGHCYTLLDCGANNRLFPDDDSYFHFHTSDGSGLTMEGYYEMGEHSFYVYDNVGNWYGSSGYINTIQSNGNMCMHISSRNEDSYLSPGFALKLISDYSISNVHASNVQCTEADLSWTDTTGSSQWMLAFGPSETELDSVTLTSPNYHFTDLEPDQQYICYLYQLPESHCARPVKYTFVTTCDTSIIVMPYNVDSTKVININGCYTIKDPGADHDYFYNNRVTLHIQSNTGDNFVMRGWVNLGTNDYLYIIDDQTGEWYWNSSKTDSLVIQVKSDRVRLEFSSNGDTSVRSGFEFNIRFNAIGNVKTSLMTDTTCRVTWDDHSSGSSWVFWYGKDKDHLTPIHTSQRMVHLHNLTPDIRYYVFITNNAVECIDTTWFEFCSGGDKCIDFANLYSCHTDTRYGRVSNPNENRGIIDEGPENIFSRHTVVTDTNASDPRTGGALRCVPHGYGQSVRLGNWDIGGQSESAIYEYIVDTTNADILLLRYAAVLEDPAHTPVNQPRFRLDILDENENPINPECYSADFVASQQLGWNQYLYDTTTVLWKDWTPVGIDLAPMQGQRIFLRLTTYDCAEMGHFGYAYFTLECQRKTLHAGACGIIDSNSFEAPEGFSYQWYNIDSSDVVLSTERTFISNQNGNYRCRASFVGASGSQCFFEKEVIIGPIFPFARFEYHIADTDGCNLTYQFFNKSVVTTDEGHQNLTRQECEDFIWIFGDNDTCYDKHPTRVFSPGYVNVRLIAKIGNGLCEDDTLRRIAIPSPCIHYDTIDTAFCQGDTLFVRDSIYTTTGYYICRNEYRSDSIVETLVHLMVNHVFDTSMNGGICEGEAYTFFGFNDSIPGDYIRHLQTAAGCDSIYRLHLVTAHRYDTVVAPLACSNVGYPISTDTLWQSGIYTDSLLSVYSCDSVVTIHLTIADAPLFHSIDTICDGDTLLFGGIFYHVAGDYLEHYTTVEGCDSIYSLQLTVNPSFLTYDTVALCRLEPYQYRGTNYLAPFNISDSLSTWLGCDSIVNFNLHLHDSTFKAAWLLSKDTIIWNTDSVYEGCYPFTLYVKDSSVGAQTLLWNFGDGFTSDKDSLSHAYETGIYNLSLIAISPEGCRDTLNYTTINTLPLPSPEFEWTPYQPTQNDPSVDFINLSEPNDENIWYKWYVQKKHSPEEYDSLFVPAPHYLWDENYIDFTGDYIVKLVAYYNHIGLSGDTIVCSDTIQHEVPITNIFLQFPSVVTPNGDGINDLWIIKNLVEFGNYPNNELAIYNRWGVEVFAQRNITSFDQFWDPNNPFVPEGTYFFVFRGMGDYGYVLRKGAIEVLRP